MASIVFPFYIDTITQELDGFAPGLPAPPAAVKISGVANYNPEASQFDQPGPWIESATVQYMAAFDQIALKIRMYKSANAGVSWVEVNAAGAPAANNDVAQNDLFFGSVRDTRPAVTKTYHVIWDTDATVSVIVFNQATDTWGAKIKSTLAFLTVGSALPFSGFTVAFRATDNKLVFSCDVDDHAFGNSFFSRTYYAICDLTALTISANWTLIGNGTRASDDRITTTVAVGGYTAGSLVLNVASTGAPMPQTLTTFMTLAVCDPATGNVKVVLNATAIVSGTRWTVVANGADANALAGDTVVFMRNWDPLGAVMDDQDNIHFQFYVAASSTVLPTYIYHQVMHKDNSFSTPDIIRSFDRPDQMVAGFARMLARPITGGGTELVVPHQRFTAVTLLRTLFVARAVAGDAPAWTYEQVLPSETGLAPSGASPWEGFALVNLTAPQIAAYYIQAVDPLAPTSTAVMAYILNNGAGFGWFAPVVIANFNWNQTAQSGFASCFSAAAGAGAAGAVGGLGPQILIFPFLVEGTCVERSCDGNVYVPVKTVLRKGY